MISSSPSLTTRSKLLAIPWCSLRSEDLMEKANLGNA